MDPTLDYHSDGADDIILDHGNYNAAYVYNILDFAYDLAVAITNYEITTLEPYVQRYRTPGSTVLFGTMTEDWKARAYLYCAVSER